MTSLPVLRENEQRPKRFRILPHQAGCVDVQVHVILVPRVEKDRSLAGAAILILLRAPETVVDEVALLERVLIARVQLATPGCGSITTALVQAKSSSAAALLSRKQRGIVSASIACTGLACHERPNPGVVAQAL
eukprot:scaffold2083_cov419-Prasinococcus_capsulatus_cf.AAC.2